MTKRLLLAGGIVPIVSLLVFHLDMVTRPGYDILRHGPSLLMLGERGWLQIANFAVTGLLVSAFAVVLWRSRAGRWGPILMGVYGAAIVAVGVFVTDPQTGYPPGTGQDVLPGINTPATWHGHLHYLAVYLAYAAAVGACFGFARQFGRPWSFALVAFGIAMPLVLLAGTLFLQPLALGSEVFALLDGVAGRLIIPLGWLWATVVALAAVRAREEVAA